MAETPKYATGGFAPDADSYCDMYIMQKEYNNFAPIQTCLNREDNLVYNARRFATMMKDKYTLTASEQTIISMYYMIEKSKQMVKEKSNG